MSYEKQVKNFSSCLMILLNIYFFYHNLKCASFVFNRNLLVDILVNLGTNPAFLFGKYLLENNKFRPQEAVYFMQQLQFHVKEVSETLLDNVQVIITNDCF